MWFDQCYNCKLSFGVKSSKIIHFLWNHYNLVCVLCTVYCVVSSPIIYLFECLQDGSGNGDKQQDEEEEEEDAMDLI